MTKVHNYRWPLFLSAGDLNEMKLRGVGTNLALGDLYSLVLSFVMVSYTNGSVFCFNDLMIRGL